MTGICTVLHSGIDPQHIRIDEPMNRHTTFKIGGPADVLVMPATTEELTFAINACRDASAPYLIMGNGSNLLVADEGIRGVVIKIHKNFSSVTQCGDCMMEAQTGISLAGLANAACEASLAGLEFASGIPGTLGGALYMNAGAYDGEMKDVFVSAQVLTDDGSIQTWSLKDMCFAYRSSALQKSGGIALSAVLQLTEGKPLSIKARMDDLNGRRRDKQPVEMPSAGSTFKRPEGYYAGKLIMDSGLGGFSIGGAQVSVKHCGFVVNTGGATADDVLRLVDHIIRTVEKNFGVTLELEIKIVNPDCTKR